MTKRGHKVSVRALTSLPITTYCGQTYQANVMTLSNCNSKERGVKWRLLTACERFSHQIHTNDEGELRLNVCGLEGTVDRGNLVLSHSFMLPKGNSITVENDSL